MDFSVVCINTLTVDLQLLITGHDTEDSRKTSGKLCSQYLKHSISQVRGWVWWEKNATHNVPHHTEGGGLSEGNVFTLHS